MAQPARSAARADHGIMIDSPDTEDRDDAVWVEHTADGFEATVHIALVADSVEMDGEPDLAARKRVHTRYLPNATVNMLPEAVERAASLSETPGQPTLRISMSFAADGETLDSAVDEGELRQAHIISYADASRLLREADTTHPAAQALHDANALAQVLLRRRQRHGALAFYDLFKGWATNEEGQLVRLGREQRNAGYIIVQELMIAANAAVAMWCAGRDVPILFRNHQQAAVGGDREDLLAELAAVESTGEAAGYETLSARMSVVQRPARYAPVVSGHHGLNLPAYTHATSPLRRYSDLVNQRILLAQARDGSTPYDLDALRGLAEEINDRIQAERERRAEHHRRQARQATRDNLDQADYDTLDTAQFTKVLRYAVTESRASLIEETGRRFDDGRLPLRDACEVLFKAHDPAWEELRQRVNHHLAAEPGRALTVLSMYAQAELGGPIGNQQLNWRVTSVGTAQQPCFEAVLELRLGDRRHESPPRRQASKKDAKSQAALALIAILGDVPDLSRDEVIPTLVVPTRSRAVPEETHPVMAVNQYLQVGVIKDVTWEFEAAGPSHAPTFSCTVAAIVLDDLAATESMGSGASKQLAKAAAASALRATVEERLQAMESAPQ